MGNVIDPISSGEAALPDAQAIPGEEDFGEGEGRAEGYLSR